MENIKDLVDRIERQQREVKVCLFTEIVKFALLEDTIKVLQLAQSLDVITDLEDVASITVACFMNDVTDIEEAVRSYFYGGEYDDLFKYEGCGRDLEIIQ